MMGVLFCHCFYFLYISNMKKGTNPSQVLMIISDITSENPGIEITTPPFKKMVEKRYNQIYSVTSKDTMISTLREGAMIHHQEEMFLVTLPQDGNKVDILAAKNVDNTIKIVVSQQKGNNASFNSTSFEKTFEKLQNFKDNLLVEQYFHLLPNELNPKVCGLNYELEVIIGMTIACGDTEIIDNERNIKIYSQSEYLKKMGILSYDIVDLDMWVINQDKIKNHSYNAVDKCHNFDEIYNKCIQKFNV